MNKERQELFEKLISKRDKLKDKKDEILSDIYYIQREIINYLRDFDNEIDEVVNDATNRDMSIKELKDIRLELLRASFKIGLKFYK